MRKRILPLLLLAALFRPAVAYNDHRVGQLDSLERVVARWTPEDIDQAPAPALVQLNDACRKLMRGYSQINREKSLFYLYKALDISEKQHWCLANADAYRYLGQSFWVEDKPDSALFYFGKALENIEEMASGATSPSNPDGYDEEEIDDARSALYGAIGNLYNTMGNIPKAMEYYERAGELFDRHGWNESNSILYYNIGETWVDERNFKAARKAYLKSETYGMAAQDSLMVANAQKGLGRMYMEKGNTWKALRYLHQADEYFSNHDLEEVFARKDTFEYISRALSSQRRTLAWALFGVLLLAGLAVAVALLSRRLRRAQKEQSETDAVIAETKEISQREREILDLLAKGYTSAEIAGALSLSPETVKWYRKRLLVKFDVANTAELVLAARDRSGGY